MFKDKKANAWVCYSKKFRITGYGRNKKEAKGMYRDTVLDILEK